VIAKISDPRGVRVAGLIYYLFGPGRREEHADPHLIAGWRHPAELEPPQRPDGRRDFRRLDGLLQQPNAALGPRGFERPVWHCAVRAAPEDRLLSDDEWAQTAGDVMHRTGLAPYGQEDEAVRWVAVRHGGDHIHIVAMLARQDGGRPRLSNERYRVREACRVAEVRYGLRRTAPGDRTAARRASRAEQEKAQRRGWRETPRIVLKRAVSTAVAGASSEREFFAFLAEAGVLIRQRFSARDLGQVTGYAVALPGDTTAEGLPVWFGGGKLAADLTLPRLRRRWASGEERFTRNEQVAAWEIAAQATRDASAQIRLFAASEPGRAADAAWAASDTLHAVASAVGSRVLRRAADSYDRAARTSYGRIPRPTPAGNSLRRTARLLSSGVVGDDRTMALVALVTRLAALAEAVAELRLAQQHTAQAAGARRAAEHLHAAAHHFAVTRRTRLRTAAEVARMDTPAPLRLTLSPTSGNREGRASGRKVRSPHRPRGPAP
jgi:hypothetical protein